MNNLVMVVTQKKVNIPSIKPYHPIVTGNKNIDIKNAWFDNIGENIANRNFTYCELTALYWVWKHKIKEFDNIGLCHYRRYFTKHNFNNNMNNILTDEDITEIMRRVDIVLPRPYRWSKTVGYSYYGFGSGKKKDLDMTRDIISKKYPSYLESFDNVLLSNEASYCNLFIMPNDKLDMYCAWLFDILKTLEEKIDFSFYIGEERRVLGFLAEILLNVWVKNNKLKIQYYPIAYVGMRGLYKFKLNLMASSWGKKIFTLK